MSPIVYLYDFDEMIARAADSGMGWAASGWEEHFPWSLVPRT